MKKMQLFKRISAMAMVFAMVGVTSAFAATGATEHESGHITESAGSKSYDIYSILYEDSTNRYRASAWAVVSDHSQVPAKYIGVDAWLCTPRDQILASTGFVYNSSGATFEYACTARQYTPQMVYAAGEVDLYTGTTHKYVEVPESPYVGGDLRAVNQLEEVKAFPVNENGDTYGTVRTAKLVGYKPDLIAAVGNGGVEGYVRMDDMRPNITSEADIEAYYEKLENDPDIPLYDMNGNVIGTFTIGGNEDLAPEATTVEEARAAIMADMSSPVVPNEDVNQTKDRLLNENDNLNTIYHEAPVNSVDVWAATSNQYTEKNGLTYGTMKQAGVIGEPPDMVSVVATNGMQGWVTLEDFSPVRYLRKIGTSEAEINSYIDKTMNKNVQKFIPVYDMEGNVIGEFPTGYSM